MGGGRTTPTAEKNYLWASSSNRCAAPDCDRPLVEWGPSSAVTHGRFAHIYAHSPGGPRWASPLTRRHVDSHENLILLCQYHHDLVDGDPHAFSPAKLLEWKSRHTRSVSLDSYLRIFSSPQLIPPPLVSPSVARLSLHGRLREALRHRRVAVTGLAGAGKTQLVSSYFRQADEGYSQRLWLKGSTREQIETQLAAISDAAEGNEFSDTDVLAAAERAVRVLNETPGYLIVLDGVQDYSQINHLNFQNGYVVAVSQSIAWPGYRRVPVGGLTESESNDLLCEYVGTEHEEERLALAEVAIECGNNALLLTQAGHYMATRGLGPSAYLELLRASREEVLERGGEARDVTFDSSLRLAVRELSRDALQLASLISLMADVPVRIEPVPELTAGANLTFLSNPLSLGDAVSSLLKYSLVERESSGIRMHQIVQRFFRCYVDTEQRVLGYAGASVIVDQQTPKHQNNADERQRLRDMIPHMEALMAAVDEFPDLAAITVPQIANRLGSFYIETGRVALGREILERGERLGAAVGEPSTLASIRHNLANAAFEEGRLEDALAESLEVLSLKEEYARENPGSESSVAYTHILVGDIYGSLGDLHESMHHNSRAAELHEIAGQPTEAAGALITVAGNLIEGLGRFEEAARTLEKVDDLLSSPASVDHISERVRAGLAWTVYHLATNDYGAAARASRRSQSLAQRDNPSGLNVVRALTLRAHCLTGLGRTRSAFALLRTAEAHLALVQDESQVTIERVRGNIAVAYLKGGCDRCGMRLATESARRLQALLPDGHPTRRVAETMLQQASAMKPPASIERFLTPSLERLRTDCPGPHGVR